MKYDEYDVIKIQITAPADLVNTEEMKLSDEVSILRDELEAWFLRRLKKSNLRAIVLYPTDEL